MLHGKLICLKKETVKNTSGTDKHILDSVTRITRFFECFTVSCFAGTQKQNLIDLSVAYSAPRLRPTCFYKNISENSFLIIMGWGIKR